MANTLLKDPHSEWGEIWKYKADKVDRPWQAKSAQDHITVVTYPSSTQNAWDIADDSDDESQWSQTERCSSTGLSSATGSRSSATSLSMRAACPGEDNDGDNVVYPFLVGYYENIEDSTTPEPNSVSQPGTNSDRLENASWRTWQKIRCNLKTISPETLNW